MTFSLLGSMAVGKTTAAAYVARALPHICVSYENPLPVLAEIRQRGLQQNTLEGFCEIQRLFIAHEIRRWELTKTNEFVLFDTGAQEIEFFTLCFPESMGFDWDAGNIMEHELNELRKCMPQHKLFLDARHDTLVKHKANDGTRSRNSFDFHVASLLPLKREWFLVQHGLDVIMVDGLDADEVGEQVTVWIRKRIES